MAGDYRKEFPDFGEMDVEIPAGFEDASWGNESCPCFSSEAAQACLWVDYKDPALREFQDGPRFTLAALEDGQHPVEPGEPLCSTDDWAVLLQAVEERRAEMAARPTP